MAVGKTPSEPGLTPPKVPEGEEPAGRPGKNTEGSNSYKKSKSLVVGGDGVLAKGKFVASKVT